MGPKTYVATHSATTTTEPAEQPDHESAPNRSGLSFAGNVDANDHNLRSTDWLFRSRAASLIWLVVRLVLGYWWINAGYQKIWGSEKAGFWFGGGAGVKGFATAGVLGSAGGKSGASYGWWAAFLHNFVLPNASWIAKLIALGELAIGIGLVIGPGATPGTWAWTATHSTQPGGDAISAGSLIGPGIGGWPRRFRYPT